MPQGHAEREGSQFRERSDKLRSVNLAFVAEGRSDEARAVRDSWLKSIEGTATFIAFRRTGNEWALDMLAARLGD